MEDFVMDKIKKECAKDKLGFIGHVGRVKNGQLLHNIK